MPNPEELDARLRRIEEQLRGDNPTNRLPLDALPLAQVRDWYNEFGVADGSQLLLPKSVGPPELAEVPHGRLYRAAAHPNIVLNTVTVVTMDSSQFNQGGMLVTGQPSRLYAPIDGLYYVQGNFIWDTNVAGIVRQTYLRKTGPGGFIDIAIESIGGNTNGDIGQNVSTIYRLFKGEYVELLVYTDATTAVVINNQAAPVLTAHWVGNFSE